MDFKGITERINSVVKEFNDNTKQEVVPLWFPCALPITRLCCMCKTCLPCLTQPSWFKPYRKAQFADLSCSNLLTLTEGKLNMSENALDSRSISGKPRGTLEESLMLLAKEDI